jgi:hypothetical protein
LTEFDITCSGGDTRARARATGSAPASRLQVELLPGP